MRRSTVDPRTELCGRLRARRAEIEQTALTRVHALSDPALTGDPEYARGLREAVSEALEYGLGAIEGGEAGAGPVPVALFAQVRQAARNGIGLDTVLRRYFAGYTLLGDFIVREAEAEPLRSGVLSNVLRDQAVLFDRLVSAISSEYAREAQVAPGSSERRRVECVEKLLDGELLDASPLAYDLGAFHLAAIAVGEGAAEAIAELAAALDRRLLLVRREDGAVWAWLGSRRQVDPADLIRLLPSCWPAGEALALGEPSRGIDGWRLSHRQARAALPIALRDPRQRPVRYAEVALLASMLGDDLLLASLRGLYLLPLAHGRDGGAVLRETLRAYFTAERNVTSAAAVLDVSRQTVGARLRTVEERLGCPLADCAADLEAALRLEDFERAALNSSGGQLDR